MNIWNYCKKYEYVIYHNLARYICQTISPFILTKRNCKHNSIFYIFSTKFFFTRCLYYMLVPMQKSSGRIRSIFISDLNLFMTLSVNWLTSDFSVFKDNKCLSVLQILSLLISFRIVTLLRERISFEIRGEVNLKTSTLILIPPSIIKKG